MKYKVGDRVFIKPWELMVREFGVLDEYEDMGAHINQPRWPWCHYDELKLAHTDRILTITHVENHYNGIHPLSEKLFIFDDDSVAGYAFDYGEMIEVSDDGYDWNTCPFVGFAAGLTDFGEYITRREGCCTLAWQYARPLKKENPFKKEKQVSIEVRCNGELIDPNVISKETWDRIRSETK